MANDNDSMYWENEGIIKRLRESIAITDRNFRAMQTERDRLRDQVQVYEDREADNHLAVERDNATHDALALLKERDALRQRVDDLTVAMTTALECLENERYVASAIKCDDARDVLAKALRKGGE